jgi:hypothetical protein
MGRLREWSEVRERRERGGGNVTETVHFQPGKPAVSLEEERSAQ